MSRDRVFRALDALQNRKQDQRRVLNAVLGLGDENKTVSVSGRPGYHWVRLFGAEDYVVPALNRVTAAVNNLPVQVAISTDFRTGRREYEVIGLADNEILTAGGTLAFDPYLPEHGSSHEWGAVSRGRDVINIYPRAFGFGRVYPTRPASMACRVSPIKYAHGRELKTFPGGTTRDFTADVPAAAGKAKLILVVLDGETNSLDYVLGTDFTWTGYVSTTIPPAAVPTIDTGQLVLSCIVLYNGMTAISEANFRYEYRLPWSTLGGISQADDLSSDAAANGYALEADGGGNCTWRPVVIISSEEPASPWPGLIWIDISGDIVLGTEEGLPIGTEEGEEIAV